MEHIPEWKSHRNAAVAGVEGLVVGEDGVGVLCHPGWQVRLEEITVQLLSLIYPCAPMKVSFVFYC